MKIKREIASQYAQHPILGINGIRLCGLRSGVGRAIEAFLREIDDLAHPFSEIRIYSPEPIDKLIYLPRKCSNVVLRSPLPNGLWEQIVLPVAHGRKGPLLCPSYVAPLFAVSPVVLIHHGSYEGYPEAFPWLTLLKAKMVYGFSARSADIVSTVSTHSQGDIEKYYGVPRSKVSVIPEGVDTAVFKPIADENAKMDWRWRWIGSDAPYLLYVGKATKRRNLGNLIKAFSNLKNNHGWQHKLVLLGAKLPGTSLDAAIQESGVASDVLSIDYADHEDITFAYNCADIFVYPSSYEGFGMPVLEAMACGTPVIALNNTAFPEFAGGIAWLLDDAKPKTLSDAVLKLADDDVEKKRMQIEVPIRAAQYDWKCLIPSYVNLLCSASGLPSLGDTTVRHANVQPDAASGQRV